MTDLHDQPGPTLILDTDSASAPAADAGKVKPAAGPEKAPSKATKPPMTARERALTEDRYRAGGLGGLLARVRLNADNTRRERLRLEAAEQDEIHFDSPQLELSDSGYVGPGGGRVATIRRVPEFRATTAQVPGLYPFTVGANSSVIGTPIGIHQETGQQVGYDCMSWHKAGLMSAPSDFVLALNGFGKSTLVRRMVFGDVAHGVIPMMLGDIRPDYSDLVRMLDGQVVDLGFGYGRINPLSVGALGSILHRLPRSAVEGAELEIQSRQLQITAALLEMIRKSRVEDFEETLITAGLRVLRRNPPRGDKPPLLEDLLSVIKDGPEEMVRASGAIEGRNKSYGPRADEQYYDLTLRLRQTLTAIIDGPFGSIFNAQSSEPLDILSGRPICIDLSRVPDGNEVLRAAALMTCWSDGFASIKAAHMLADHALEPKRLFHAVMDELARVLSTGGGVVDRVDELTRIQRGIGTGTTMISHTLKDLAAFDSIADRNKALGFFERARAKIIGPVPPDEVGLLRGYIDINEREAQQITGWASSANPIDDPVAEELRPGQDPELNPAERTRAIPHGTGKFLLKTGESGESSGIPFRTEITSTERNSGVHNTNARFETECA